MLIGYARVSTTDQTTESQRAALRAAGCKVIHEETGSGGDRERPVLRQLLATLTSGDVLVVYKLDRVARSLSHLLDVVETLHARGVKFRSISDPVDTSSPQGRFTIQILGAVAELERALIRERTTAGLAAARANGRVGGNPDLKDMTDAKRMRLRIEQRAIYLAELQECEAEWLAKVRSGRPHQTWKILASAVNARLEPSRPKWTGERLRRAAQAYVALGKLEAHLLARAPSGRHRARSATALHVVVGFRRKDPDMSTRAIAAHLTDMAVETPRGGSRWASGMVHRLIQEAIARKLLPSPDAHP